MTEDLTEGLTEDKDKPLAPVPDDERERRVEELDRELSGSEAREQARVPGSEAEPPD